MDGAYHALDGVGIEEKYLFLRAYISQNDTGDYLNHVKENGSVLLKNNKAAKLGIKTISENKISR